MTEQKLDRIEGKEISYLVNQAGKNYRIFEFNKEKAKVSIVSLDGKLVVDYEMNHDPSFDIQDTDTLIRLSTYLLIELSKEYVGIL